MILFIENSRQCKLIQSDRANQQLLGDGGEMGGRDYNEAEGNSWGRWYVHYLDCGNCFMGVYICQMCDKSDTLSILRLLCNYTLVKQRWTFPKGEGGEEEKGRKEERKGERGISAL